MNGQRYDLNRLNNSAPRMPFLSYEAVATDNTLAQIRIADNQRTAMAEQLYVLLWLAVRPDPGDPDLPGLTRTLAQIAVNIVDFMDTDSVMTRMVFDQNLTDGAGWDGPGGMAVAAQADNSNVVLGFELPELVINEAQAVAWKTDLDPDGPGALPATPVDRVYLFTELRNPWPQTFSKAESQIDSRTAILRHNFSTQAAPIDVYKLRFVETAPSTTTIDVDLTGNTGAGGAWPVIVRGFDGNNQSGLYFLDPLYTDPATMETLTPAPVAGDILQNWDPTTNPHFNPTSPGDVRPTTNVFFDRPQSTTGPWELTVELRRLRNPFLARGSHHEPVRRHRAACCCGPTIRRRREVLRRATLTSIRRPAPGRRPASRNPPNACSLGLDRAGSIGTHRRPPSP